MKQINDYLKYALVIVLLYLSYLVVKPFLSVIVLSLVLVYMIYPLHKKLRRTIKESISAGLITLALVLIIIIPTLFLGHALLEQASKLYISTNPDTFGNILSAFNINISPELQTQLNDITKTATVHLMNSLANFIFSIPSIIINFFIALVIIYYGLKDGDKAINSFIDIFPIKESYRNLFIHKITSTIESLFYGTLALSVIESAVAIIGFYLLGVSNPLIWGLAIFITAILPGIGPMLVWLPITIIFIIQGNITQAILTAIFGSLIISTLIDTFLRIKILGYRANINPVIMIVGVIGGVAAFGLIGVIIGPLILCLLELSILIYKEIKNETQS